MLTSSTGSQRHCSGPGLSQYSGQSTYEERCVDPLDDWTEAKTVQTSHLKDVRAQEPETLGFIPGSADATAGAQSCAPCGSHKRCRGFVCSVLTCGLYRVCLNANLLPCLVPIERYPDERAKVSLQAVNAGDAKEEEEEDAGWLEDLHIGGVKVNSQRLDLVVVTEALPHGSLPRGQERLTTYESVSYDDWEDGDGDVDSLITKKLLDLYSEYQIEELARCTSDSVFLKKTNEINQLISSLAEEHKLGEQEAECRLVRGIIRISTRKSKKRRPQYVRAQTTLSDSGNETMRDSDSYSFSNNNDYKSNPNIQISEQTHSDVYARKMRTNNEGYTSASTTPHPPTRTEADSSGVPLLCSSVRA
ncbi:keratinocyte differentiation factor 1 [Lampris incognitus]|uniref:keratinocyte differentiation factor 1 n=1 Tax=Lampris incognitus TaxID=2546036 RepID=UPI0024B534A8|nr:keratinocyte differentiation factor 1 [Lampris incognitus]